MRRPRILHIPRQERHSCHHRRSPPCRSCRLWSPCNREFRRNPPHRRRRCRCLQTHRPHTLGIPRQERRSCRLRRSPSCRSCTPWNPCNRKPRRNPQRHRHRCLWMWTPRPHILRIPRRAHRSCHRRRSPSCRSCTPSHLCSQKLRRNLQCRHRRCQSQSTRRPHKLCNLEQQSHRNRRRRSPQGCSCTPSRPCNRPLRQNHTRRRHPRPEHSFHRSRRSCLGSSQGIHNFHRQTSLSRRSCTR